MNILILGGSGFVSGTLAHKALSAGHEVWTVTRGQRAVPQGVHSIIADRKNHRDFAASLKGIDVQWDLAVDCIGFNKEDATQDLEYVVPYVSSFVFISTDFVYDPATRSVPQMEDPAAFRIDGYGGNKRAAELVFLENNSFSSWTILRPCHIYGPGSLLGCLPLHGRDPDLLRKMQDGETLRLVNGGTYLQQPIYCSDLADVILSVPDARQARGKICNVCGPDVIESSEYYKIIGRVLGKDVVIEGVPEDEFVAENPAKDSFLCHRVYDSAALMESGLTVPSTPVEAGLRTQVLSLSG